MQARLPTVRLAGHERPCRGLRRDRVDPYTGPELESGREAETRYELHVPVERRVGQPGLRRRANDQVEGRLVKSQIELCQEGLETRREAALGGRRSRRERRPVLQGYEKRLIGRCGGEGRVGDEAVFLEDQPPSVLSLRRDQIAEQAADVVATDDNFASIFAGVEEGRVIFDNVRLVTFFLISSGVGEVMAVLASIFFGFEIPFLPAQLLWLNLVTNGIQDVALAFEPGEKDVLKRKPRPLREGIISPLLWERTLITGTVLALGTLFLFLIELDGEDTVERARTVALTTMVLFQLFHVGNCRSESRSAFAKSPLINPFLLLGSLGSLSLHVGAMYFGPAQDVLHLEALSLGTWGAMIGVASSVIVVNELHKLIRRPA